MGDFLRIILDSIAYLWPLKIVTMGEAGCVYVRGRFWKKVGPGIYIIVPFFMSLNADGVVRRTLVTPLQTIPLKDGSTLTFSVSVQIEVEDLEKAQCLVLDYHSTAMEDTGSLLAELLASTKETLFEPERRADLLRKCRDSLSAELGEYGVKVLTIRFNNFVRNMRVYRLFNDQIYTSHD